MSTEEDDDRQRDEERGGDDGLRKEIDAVWNQITINDQQIKPEVDDRPGWKTVRIFVSSTFKDFHEEREILVKKVFADLRAWCEERQLHLIDCDLRWGVPKETTSEVTVKTCLEEIDRCYEDNKVPYFVNMTCKRVGWIPSAKVLPQDLVDKYQLVFGLSVTEMEIVHAAYRIENPNALFLIRDDSFINEIEDEEMRKDFVDAEQPLSDTKLIVLKNKIESRFQERVFTYSCKYVPGERPSSSLDSMTKDERPKFDLDENFSKIVLDFFKTRIGEQYPPTKRESDEYLEAAYHHEAFMRSRSDIVLGYSSRSRRDVIIGREEILKEINDYVEIEDDSAGFPKLIVGEAGAGKSSVMVKAVSTALERMETTTQPGRVFFHFVGAVPNSTSLLEILRRLLKQIQPNIDLPEALEETEQLIKSKLTDNRSGPIIIFIDAVNQIDVDLSVDPMFWLPEKLAPDVRCILSLISGSEPHRALQRRKNLQTKDTEILIPDLEAKKRFEIVNSYLSLFNKTLTPEQVVPFFEKRASNNPLWLRIACEELRVYGHFSKVTQFITTLADTLPGLLRQVLERFEKETDRVLLISTLCLLEASRFGLLEVELLEILADKENLEYRETSGGRGEGSRVEEQRLHLPSAEWASVYRNLRIFLRPYGNPSEGRLDFYHRTLSEVVQDVYLRKEKSDADYNEQLLWWHKKLVDFYRNSRTYDRKVEELPHHLLFLKRNTKNTEDEKLFTKWLQEFLLDMETFKRLFNNDYSQTLLFYWRESGDERYDQMCEGYEREIREMQKDVAYTPQDITTKFEDVSRLMVQAGRYKEALVLAEECLEMVVQFPNQFEKEERDEKLMYLYGHIAHIKTFLLPPNQSAKEIPKLHSVIELHGKAIQIINDSAKQSERKYKKYLALQLTKTAYARSEIARRSETIPFPKSIAGKKTRKEMIDQGRKEVERSISLYQELKEYGRELDSQLTKATLYSGNRDMQLEIYKRSRRRCRQLFGKENHVMSRLCFNTAIVYEESDDTDNAYKYFSKAFHIAFKVFGSEHCMTRKYRDALNEKRYAAVAKKQL